MQKIRCAAVLSVVVAAAACTGAPGAAGKDGAKGDTGPAGPITASPVLTSVDPAVGSAHVQVHVLGTGFSTVVDDDHVYFDGQRATVLSASATELVVEPSIVTRESRNVVVSVEVAHQASNALGFTLVAAGSSHRVSMPLPTAPTGVVKVGSDIYIAAGTLFTDSSGLYKRSADGTVTRVLDAEFFDVPAGSGGPPRLFDGPVALATDGTRVFFTSGFGAVRVYDPATGTVEELIAGSLTSGSGFPTHTGIVVDSDGTVFVLDRGQGALDRLRADGSFKVFNNAAFGDAFGLALLPDGLAVMVEQQNVVMKATFSGSDDLVLNATFATGVNRPRAGVVNGGGELVVSDDSGHLFSVPAASGGGFAPTLSTDGYLYQADGMFFTADGSLLIAQATGSVVREIPVMSLAARIVAAGSRVTFGTVLDGHKLLLATIGQGVFGGPPSLNTPDGAVLSLDLQTGASHIVTGGLFPAGLVVRSDGKITIADCFASTITTVNPSDGSSTVLLDSTAGLSCPGGLVLEANGDLAYTNSTIGAPTPSTIGVLDHNGVNHADFATGLPPSAAMLVQSGNSLLAMSFPFGSDPQPLVAVNATTGGAAVDILPPAEMQGGAALGACADGSVFFLRIGLGDVTAVDVANKSASHFGRELADVSLLSGGGGGGGPGAGAAFGMACDVDNTLLVSDFGQSGIIAVMP